MQIQDISQYLKDTENSLRDLILWLMVEKFGLNWENKCGISDKRLQIWQERLASEAKRGIVSLDNRLIYYADLYDLETIIHKNWNTTFVSVFQSKKEIEVILNYLEQYRNADSHRRELLPHQKHLIIGIAGELRSQIIRYRSSIMNKKKYFPVIECVRDNLGNICLQSNELISTNTVLVPGDILSYTVTASDPEDRLLQYSIELANGPMFQGGKWQNENYFEVTIEESHICEALYVQICIKSDRKFHAKRNRDDVVCFKYSVLPKI